MEKPARAGLLTARNSPLSHNRKAKKRSHNFTSCQQMVVKQDYAVRCQTESATFHGPSDGSRIAFISLEGEEPKSDPKVIGPSRHRRLSTIRPDAAIPEPVIADGITVWEYSWSPDSKQLALHYALGPDDTDWYRSQIGVVAAQGGAVRQVTNLTWQIRALAWSPDSTQISYVSGSEATQGVAAAISTLFHCKMVRPAI